MKILYEDNHIIVAYKESGLLSQEDYTKDDDILTLLKKYIKDKYNKPGNVYLGLIHRLDRMTSGIMVFARTSKAASRLSQDIKTGSFNKSYYAIVHGNIKYQDTLRDYLYKNEELNKSFIGNKQNGKEAILEYEKINTFIYKNKTFCLLKVSLITGRHHQIRVQFSSRGYPLYGDTKYSNEIANFEQFFLCAYKLSFIHPVLKIEMKYEIEPEDFIFQTAKKVNA